MKIHSESVITAEEVPKEIVNDVQTFLDYVEQHKIKLTKSREYVKRKDLREIYARLENRKPAASGYGNQDDYPMIHLLFHLTLTLGLTYKTWSKSGASLMTDPSRIDIFQELNTTEKYITLLNTFWTNMDWDELQKGRIGKVPSNVDLLLEYLEEQPFAKTLHVTESDLAMYLYSYESFLYYFDYFGFWEFEEKDALTESTDYPREIEPKSIKLMPTFKKFIPALVETWSPGNHASDPLSSLMKIFGQVFDEAKESPEEEEELESLFSVLQPLFAKGELQNILLVPGEGEPVTGNFTLNVSLTPSCLRKIRLPGSATLQEMHSLIQEAFAFDDDHLYSFFMDGKRFGKDAYHSPMDIEGPYAHEKEIGRLNLYTGMRFLYLFDYGDEWVFHITVEEIEEEEEEPAAIVGAKGGAPDQYG
ncbi:hypothetical protein [Lentibacillus sp. CBA3610]|uniref:IS1096 element passenger TnpR family protein n=1 Tax=Lentibacillus sp. CBA3610 TaxID=2518176 RepID=UPI001595BD3A|nr:hypothetical protein [Lentibacillus sp. CBA3610]